MKRNADRHLAILFAVFTLLVATPALAQRIPGPRFASGAVWVAGSASPTPKGILSDGVLGDGSNDYRYAGFWIGVGTGLGLAYMASKFCHESEGGCDASTGQEIFGTLMIAGTVSLFGALIGAQFDR